MFRNLGTGMLLMLLLAAGAAAQQAAKPEIKKVPARYTSPASGKGMYEEYCASCHGQDGKGSGPAAPAMKTPPTDLTTLAKSNGGKFPSSRFTGVLTGQATVVAHGSQDMPVWGKVFWTMSGGHPAEVQLRIFNLSTYVQSLQQK
jgi:mono/diheme cytochrome c family protein